MTRLRAIAAVVLAAAAGCQSVPDPDFPSIHVFDQRPFYDTVVVQDAVSVGPGWIVVQERLNGRPGAVVGYAPVKAGLNRWVRIPVDVEPPSTLFAALHVDSGGVGTLELPSPDNAALSGPLGMPVIASFRIIEESRFLEGR